ncbi:MAG: 2'-5' RNA ligase family protein [Anaerolineae bacterium]|nr:2'-5' RNA ligase family protein [Gloeobacterales cyanobacterium ES-bin-313]
MPKIRKQLSMYVPTYAAQDIEAVRKVVDPIQSSLIPAHITLCREDELPELSKLKDRLNKIPFKPLTLSFGKPEIFSGHGLLLNCIEGEYEFQRLREYVLDSKGIRNQKPHITLAHPRNPKSAGNLVSGTSQLPEIIEITFPTIYLIEQEMGEPWHVLERYELHSQAC